MAAQIDRQTDRQTDRLARAVGTIGSAGQVMLSGNSTHETENQWTGAEARAEHCQFKFAV